MANSRLTRIGPGELTFLQKRYGHCATMPQVFREVKKDLECLKMPFQKDNFGSIEDVGMMMMAIPAIGLMIIITFMVISQFMGAMDVSSFITPEASSYGHAIMAKYVSGMNNGYLIFVGGSLIVTVIAAAMIPAFPFMIPVYVIMLAALTIACYYFGQVFEEIIARPTIAPYAAQFSTIVTVNTYLPIIAVVMGFIVMGVMYKVRQ